jgi:hypothetical protein
MVNVAENVAAATPEQLREVVLLHVERAETRDRGLGAVTWTRSAGPFFPSVRVAPPDGLGPPIAIQHPGAALGLLLTRRIPSAASLALESYAGQNGSTVFRIEMSPFGTNRSLGR